MKVTQLSETSEHVRYGGLVAGVIFAVALVYTLIYWIVGALAVYLLSTLTVLFMKPEAHRNLGHRTLGCLFRGFFHGLVWMGAIRIEDDELEPVAEMAGPLIIASNHPSLWDAPLLIRKLVTVSCIMKAEITNNPILYGGTRFAGFLPNRPKLDMVRAATGYLKSGGRLLLFPEGTRTRDESRRVNKFRPGLALMAKTAKCPILPVFLKMNSGYMQKGWPIWKMPPLPIVCRVEVGELIHPDASEATHAFSDRLEEYYREELRDRFPR
ncbi:1-acyl-sn-glycerol-3-phosphate acyltransferase [Verrucomicrobiaceae bacterium 5K15]|uniref:1-acyl-sn-glycerol-3-phosphate acyltransferase n=1 Tax=Oceaniferula flava TaxID=2800421 RepID=A0AAE2V845_9BACT|nr:lysophospholipid acyltransferase family protein [Oceaniferula flavus]MBK1854922.1 1-acyl-sn-glycerol-3-phosphate acyltransferase [Oceaniferula flavus]MBM1136228.1 1-acyl-sn-glycerol-3-phosphate acyltransferase [Oceaniferula flavus]